MANVYEITLQQISEFCQSATDESMLSEISLETKTTIAKELLGQYGIKRGDVVQFGGRSTTNKNLLFWDGEKLITPSYHFSEHGTVPEYFEVGSDSGFKIHHWFGKFNHLHNIIYLKEEVYRDIIQKFKLHSDGKFECTVMISGEEIEVCSWRMNIIGRAMIVYPYNRIEVI